MRQLRQPVIKKRAPQIITLGVPSSLWGAPGSIFYPRCSICSLWHPCWNPLGSIFGCLLCYCGAPLGLNQWKLLFLKHHREGILGNMLLNMFVNFPSWHDFLVLNGSLRWVDVKKGIQVAPLSRVGQACWGQINSLTIPLDLVYI